MAFVAIDLTVVKVLDHVRLDQKGPAIATLPGRIDQGHDSARVTLYAAMVVRALPEAPRPVLCQFDRSLQG